MPAELTRTEGAVGTKFEYQGKKIEVAFLTTAAVGGHISIRGGAQTIGHDFVQGIDYSLHNWKNDPRHRKWMSEPRFGPFLPPADRKKDKSASGQE